VGSLTTPWQRRTWYGPVVNVANPQGTSTIRLYCPSTAIVVYGDARQAAGPSSFGADLYALVRGQRVFIGSPAISNTISGGNTGILVQANATGLSGGVDGWEVTVGASAAPSDIWGVIGFAYGRES
jgi:hypothetical protein